MENIPDVSNEEVDDIRQIKYTKQAETTRICTRASKKLSRLSTTRINIQEMTCNRSIQPEPTPPTTMTKPITKFKRIKSKILGPPAVSSKVAEGPKESKLTDNFKLYPCLDNLNTSLTHLNLKCQQPPPTYSDSESFYSGRKSCGAVLPSAPSLNLVEGNKELETEAIQEYQNESIYEENKVKFYNEQEIANIQMANNIRKA